MPVQISQADLDTKRADILAKLTAYHDASVAYQAEVGPRPSHLTLTDDPHQVTAAQVGLGNVPNYPVATPAEHIAGSSDAHFATPVGLAAAIDDVLTGVSAVGYRDQNTGQVAKTLITTSGRYFVESPIEISLSIAAGASLQVVLEQGDTAHAITWGSTIRWALLTQAVWSDWTQITRTYSEVSYTEQEAIDERQFYIDGVYNTSTEEYRNVGPMVTDSVGEVEWSFTVEERTLISPAVTQLSAMDTPYGRWLLEFHNADGYTYGQSTYLGRTVNDAVTSQCPSGTSDRLITQTSDESYHYVGTLAPGGPVEYTTTKFTQDILDAIGLVDGSMVDPSLVNWEVMVVNGRTCYLPTRPLFDAVTYDTLRTLGLVHGETVIRVPTRGTIVAGEWDTTTAYMSFRVAMLGAGAIETVPFRNRHESTLPTISSVINGLPYSQFLNHFIDPANRPINLSPTAPFKNGTQADMAVDRGIAEWAAETRSSLEEAVVLGNPDLSHHYMQPSFKSQQLTAAFRPILIAEYSSVI